MLDYGNIFIISEASEKMLELKIGCFYSVTALFLEILYSSVASMACLPFSIIKNIIFCTF